MKIGLIAGGGFLLFSVLGSLGQEAKEFVLAKKEFATPVGKSYLAVYKSQMRHANVDVDTPDFSYEGKMDYLAEEERLVTFPKKDQIRFQVRKMRRQREVRVDGSEPFETDEPHEMAGKTLLFEKKEGVWSGGIEGDKALENEHKEIAEMIQRLKLWLNSGCETKRFGLEPRKVGEEWEADPSSHPLMAPYKIKEGSYKLRFKEVKEFLGEPCAVIEAEFSIVAEGLVGSEKGMVLSTKGTSRTIRSLKSFIDYKYSDSSDYSMEGPIEGGGEVKTVGKLKMDVKMIPQDENDDAKEEE